MTFCKLCGKIKYDDSPPDAPCRECRMKLMADDYEPDPVTALVPIERQLPVVYA